MANTTTKRFPVGSRESTYSAIGAQGGAWFVAPGCYGGVWVSQAFVEEKTGAHDSRVHHAPHIVEFFRDGVTLGRCALD